MIEMVTEAETLRKIQVELGLTGSFKDRPIAEWLAKHNPSALEYERAVDNFTGNAFKIILLLLSLLLQCQNPAIFFSYAGLALM